MSGFVDAMVAAGLTPPADIESGRFYRFPGVGKSNGNTAGWCKLFDDGLGGAFGDFSSGFEQNWQAKRERGHRAVVAAQPIRTPAPKPEAPSTAAYAAQVWGRVVRGDDVVAAHPYAQRKGVRHACGAGRTTASGRIVGKDADCLIVPIRLGGVGEVVAVQAINAEGAKQTFGPMADAFLLLGDERDQRAHWFISEGWATAYAFHQLYQPAVACVSFGKSRLQNVGMAAARLFAPDRLVIAQEQDQ